MSKVEIIENLAKSKRVEKLIDSYSISSPYKEDLAQDIYIELLRKDEMLIYNLHINKEFDYYIRKIIKNNINSTTSPFYKNYEKFRKNSVEITNEKQEEEE